MQIREATETDAADLRWIARSSLRRAYDDAVSPTAIDEAIESWYGNEAVAETLADPECEFLVAEEDGDPIAFVEYSVSEGTEEATIQWVHVDANRWNEGIGDALLAETEDRLFDQGVERIEGTAITENEDLVAFYEEHDYIPGIDRETTIGEETFTERSYLKFAPGETPRLIEERETDGGTFYIALDDHKVGSAGDFFVAYKDQDRNARYGYFCNNCGSVDTVMDSMGRVQCTECSNTAKPTRWDAAYL